MGQSSQSLGVSMHWLDENIDTWLEYTVGDVPLLLTFAHAGQRLVEGIEGRNETQPPNNTHDARTREVAEAMLLNMDWYGLRPYMIIPQVSRREVDLNRSWGVNQEAYIKYHIADVAQNKAREIHDGFYEKIQSFINDMRSRFTTDVFQRALLIDIHGFPQSDDDDIDDDIEIEIGTRNHTSADASIVYTSTIPDTITLMDMLKQQGFVIRSDAATTEWLNGVEVLEVNGRKSGGLNAVQLELSQPLRGFSESSNEMKKEVARQTGTRLALALEHLLISNKYPTPLSPEIKANDDDIYAAIML